MSKKVRPLSKKVGQLSKKCGHDLNQPILEYFYENPHSKATVRELALKLGMIPSTVQYNLKLLQAEKIISSENRWLDNWQNRLKKTNYYLEKIAASGLIDYLETELAASAIILFGSFRKGESVAESDLDLFVECAREKELNLSKFEQELGHKIQLFTQKKITQLPPRLLNNVINGIKLKGYFTIK